MAEVSKLQNLYDRNLFLQAFQESVDSWTANTKVESLSTEELVFGSRLAARLGGPRLSRWLVRKAGQRDPENRLVRLAMLYYRSPKSKLLDDIRQFEDSPDLGGDDNKLRAHWYAIHGVMWANLRDFERAHDCINRSEALCKQDTWVMSCKANVLATADRWDEALAAAEEAWALCPGSPATAHALGNSLLNLGRAEEAAARLTASASDGESFEVAALACWHQCVLAETLAGEDRRIALDMAWNLTEKVKALAPLADRDVIAGFARMKVDVAALSDDHEEMLKWAEKARGPFYRMVADNLRKNPHGKRVRLAHRRTKQRYQECLPASVSSALSTFEIELDPRDMASEITFGGTHYWTAVDWLEKRGFAVRMFSATAALTATLVRAGFSFVLGIETDDFSHAVNVVGFDEATGTVLFHDPSSFRTAELLMSSLGKGESPIGPKAMAVVPQERAEELDRLLPSADVHAMTELMVHQKTRMKVGVEAAGKVVEDLAKVHPNHPLTRYLFAIQAQEEGRTREALTQLQELLREFPGSSMVRLSLLSACRSLGNSALLRAVLADVVETGTLPGIQAQQEWRYPPNTYVCQFADLLRLSASTRTTAGRLLNGVLRRQFNVAEAWHNLGDLLWHEGDLLGRLVAFRIAANLAINNEHYARSYCDALAHLGKREQGLEWLEHRARKYGAKSLGAASWVTWAAALEHWGEPERALKVCNEANRLHPQSPELQSYLAFFLVRLGNWDEANSSVKALQSLGNAALHEEAAAMIARLSGNLDDAIRHCESWVKYAPHSFQARESLLNVVRKKRGPRTSVQLAAEWIAGRPGDDELERLYASELERGGFPRWRKDLLLSRRVRRNAEDGWAWRELAFRRIADYGHASPERRGRLLDRVQVILNQCERTAPEDPATVRANAYWNETVGNWKEAARLWLDSIEREPNNGFSYQRLWLCSAALPDASRAEILAKIREFMQSCTSRVPFVKDLVSLIAQSLGSVVAEAFITQLQEKRPTDPDVIKAAADLLTEMGQGRSDASRALQILEPAVARFPYHLGLHCSLVNTFRKLGLTHKAEVELREIIRRFPGEEPAYLQLAKLLDYVGKRNEITPVMNAAFARNPDSSEMWATRVRILARNSKFAEARAVIDKGIQLLPDVVNWRAKAINLLMECGDPQGAVQVAREGVKRYPRGAYPWFLLGNVLNLAKEFARPGEVEACFRTSLSLNETLMEAADLLAVILAEQRRYDEAEAVLAPLLRRYPDPSAVRGRLAWLEWHKGRKPEAIKSMQAILGDAPWYRWGWAVLMEWIVQDKAWDLGRIALREIPGPFRGDTNFRKQRLGVLEKCGLSDQELESEWQGLLKDFPEDVPLHLQRYDSLRTQRRFDESAKLLRNVESLEPNNPFLRARLAEVLLSEKKYSEAIESICAVWFQEVENSTWPVDYSWNAVKNAGLQLRVYQSALDSLRKGLRATPRALHALASHALGEVRPGKVRPKPVWSTWYLTKGTREVLSILQHLDSQSGNDSRRITVLLQELVSRGYHRHIISYWKKNYSSIYSNVEVWGQVGYCLLSLGHKAEAREHLSEWSQRRGVQMWMVTNYVWSCPKWSRDSREHIRATCQQALLQLPHDHSAKYLVHVLAESQAILGDQTGFLETAEKYRLLLDGAVKKSEYFEDRQKYLLTDIPRLVETLKLKGQSKFVRSSKVLRLKQIPFILLSRIKVQ